MKLDFSWAVQNLHLLSEVQPYVHWMFYNPLQWEIKEDILICDTVSGTKILSNSPDHLRCIFLKSVDHKAF